MEVEELAERRVRAADGGDEARDDDVARHGADVADDDGEARRGVPRDARRTGQGDGEGRVAEAEAEAPERRDAALVQEAVRAARRRGARPHGHVAERRQPRVREHRRRQRAAGVIGAEERVGDGDAAELAAVAGEQERRLVLREGRVDGPRGHEKDGHGLAQGPDLREERLLGAGEPHRLPVHGLGLVDGEARRVLLGRAAPVVVAAEAEPQDDDVRRFREVHGLVERGRRGAGRVAADGVDHVSSAPSRLELLERRPEQVGRRRAVVAR
mmetsp:Transcript_28559/g.92360  ORF Transcript_28559/g.92360 Transcript_28559/m.92360 type:complete len:270 (-) Transcript_28559:86-895(-)